MYAHYPCRASYRCTVDGQLRTRLCSTTILLNRHTCALSEMLLKKTTYVQTCRCGTNVASTWCHCGRGRGQRSGASSYARYSECSISGAAHLPGGQFVPATTIGASRIRTHRKQAISNANGSRQDS